MAGNAGTYLQAARLNWRRGIAYPTPPTATYIALFTVAPANDGTGGTEVSGGGYVRQAVSTSGWAAPSGASPMQTSNLNPVNFPTATADWGTLVAWAEYDVASGGNLTFTSNLTTGKTIGVNDSFGFPVGALVIQEN